jgi:hypothetical protein
MTNVFTNAGRRYRFRAFTLLAVLLGACDTDRLTTSPDSQLGISTDSAALADSAAADSSALADSLALTDSLPVTDDSLVMSAALSRRAGTPYGPDGLWAGYTTMKRGYQMFTASVNSDSPAGIIKRINAARAARHQLVLMMTGGGHNNYISRGRFDYGKWRARMDRYRTPAIRAAVAAGVAAGTVLGNNMLDEPNHASWGGVITKAVIDRMAAHVKSIFPTLPVGVSIRWDWRPSERYRKLDFIVTQYVTRFGSATTWKNQALAAARKNGIALVFSFNPLNGGTKIRGCPLGRTGGHGTYGGNCRMTPAQIRTTGYALAGSTCAVLMWRYDGSFMLKAANASAFKAVTARLSNTPRGRCRRS